MNDRLTEASADLRAAFAAEFAKLKQIDAAFAAALGSGLEVATDTLGNGAFEVAAVLETQDVQRDAVSVGSGAVAGAVIGSMVFPVIGTFIGAFFGSLRERPISAVREEAIARAVPAALEFVDDTGDQLVEYVEDVATEARGEPRRRAGSYSSAYETAVQAVKEANITQQRALRDRCTLLQNLRLRSQENGPGAVP